MDPEIRYGRAYVPRSTYSYITTTNLDRKSKSRGYSQPPPTDRNWSPTTTYWMPKRDWYYGAYEDLYAPSSSLKSRLASKDTNISRKRLVDDIHYELNRFRPPHLASDGKFPSRKMRDAKTDNWQDRLDMYYPSTNGRPYVSDYVKDNFSNARLSRRSQWNNEALNDLHYDYDVLHRGRLNDHPGLPRRSPYGPISVQPSLYEDVKDYMFPSHRPLPRKPMKGLSYLDSHEDWLKTSPFDFQVPDRFLGAPSPSTRSYSSGRPRSAYDSTPSAGRGRSFSPTRKYNYKTREPASVDRTPASTYSAPERKPYRSEPEEPAKPRTPRATTFAEEPVSERPRAREQRPAREPSPPARESRRKPVEEEPQGERPSRPDRAARAEPEEPNLEKRRIPPLEPQKSMEGEKTPKRPSLAEEPTTPKSPRRFADEEPQSPVTKSPRRSIAEEPAAPSPKVSAAPSPRVSAAPSPRESVSEQPSKPATPRRSVADEPTPRASVASTSKSPKPSVAEEPEEEVEAPEEPEQVFEEPEPEVEAEPEPEPEPEEEPEPEPQEPEEEIPAEEEEEIPAEPEEREPSPAPEEEEVPAEEEEVPAEEEAQPEEEEPEPAEPAPTEETEEFEWQTEEGGRKVTTTTTKTTTETTYEEEVVEEYEEEVTEEHEFIEENGTGEALEYEEEEEENVAPISKKKRWSDEDIGDVNGSEEVVDEEEE